MKILKLQYILILAVLIACQDESFQVPMEENEVHIATENEILLKRGYSDYTLTAERLAGLEGCRIRTKEGFVFLSDSIVRSGEPLTIEVEQNPYQEERLGELEFTDRQGAIIRTYSLRQASSLSQTVGEAYSGALMRSYGVGYGYDADEGKRLWMQTRAALRAKYPAAQCEVGLLQIGSTIAVHTGPYALGMGIMRRWKKQ